MSTQTMSKWVIDPSHSEIMFKVKHLMISTVSGTFGTFQSSFDANDDFSQFKAEFTADTATIQTGNEQRDGHLKSDDFFNSASFPQLRFVSTKLEKSANDSYALHGELTIRDITKHVLLNVQYNGSMTDPYGNHKAGFEITGQINRKDFNLMWSFTTEAGGVVVSDEVKLHCNIQFVRQS